jgi:putative toxin-antitoxin system antitoxin component (TIGR02293 family)
MEDLTAVMELLGGRRVIGEPPATLLSLVERVRRGLPPSSFGHLAQRLELSEEELAEAVGISRRTLTRRKREPRFDPQESEAVVRVARIAVQASEALGDLAAAHRWLRKGNRALGGRTPLSLLDTGAGAELVSAVLERIEHGTFS